MADLLWFLTAPNVVLSSLERVGIFLVTCLHYLFEGTSPEEIIFTLCGFAFMLVVMRFVSACSQQTPFVKFFLCAIIPLLIGQVCVHFFTSLPPLPQSTYGTLPIFSPSDVPILPSVGHRLICDGEYFKDEHGRVLLLRGVNLGGDTKVPTRPDGSTWNLKDFFAYQNVSFVGRPFPLEEADEHLARLRSWGFTFVRFLVTWEAIEHEGPKKYDHEYLEYVRQVIRKCAKHGISVFIDPHQDVWSRWTGGDGAPAWTLEKAGFNISALYSSGAAFTHQQHGDPLPRMMWPLNYHRLATATMFTLFFAGHTYAPRTVVEGVSIQDYLQNHYFGAIGELAKYLHNESNVLGYDTLNEPSNGYVGFQDLSKISVPASLGWVMSPFQSMLLGAGMSQDVPFFAQPFVFTRRDTLNPKGQRAWTTVDDIWQREGVWDFVTGVPTLLRPKHFANNAQGEAVDFQRDFMVPFYEKFQRAIHAVHPDTVIFVEPAMLCHNPKLDPAPSNLEGDRLAWAPHYYDVLALMMKTSHPSAALDVDGMNLVFGKEAAERAIAANFHHLRQTAQNLGKRGAPCLVGETGIPMDMDRDANGLASAYKTNDFSAQIRTLDRLMRGLESNFLSFTLWNYAAQNNNKRGDLWNDEDLSLFSRAQQFIPYSASSIPLTADLYSGGRALAAAVRPYPMKTAGVPVSLQFDMTNRVFRFEFSTIADTNTGEVMVTVFFVPSLQYPGGNITCTVSDGEYEHDVKNNVLKYRHDPTINYHTVVISPSSAAL